MNLIDVIKNAGVVGAGGAGFPTHLKLNAKADWFIVNAAECEGSAQGHRRGMRKENNDNPMLQ